MKNLLVAAGAAGMLVFASIPAQADTAHLVTFSTSGKIAQGTDEFGLFGFNQLAGQQFILSVTVDTSTLQTTAADSTRTVLDNKNFGAHATGEITINGHTFSWTLDNANASVAMMRPYEWFGARPDLAGVTASGDNAAGYAIYAANSIASSKTPFMTSVDIARDVVFDPGLPGVESSAYFSISKPTGVSHPGGPVYASTWFSSQSPLSTAQWSAAPVPEPGQAGMLAVGLAACLAMARTRRRKAVARRRFEQ
jgi:hypothetical protein